MNGITFKTAREALEWFVIHRVDPLSSMSNVTDSCSQILEDGAISGSTNPDDLIGLDDTIHAIVDLEKIINEFPPAMRNALVRYGLHGHEYALDKMNEDTSGKWGRRTARQKKLYHGLWRFYKRLRTQGYVAAKKIWSTY